MNVQAINTQNNQTSFGAIYQPKNINFSKVQEPIVEVITKAMREPLQKFKGKTTEKFYKSKGFDFGISPTPNHMESVSLYAYKEMKETGRGVDRHYTCQDSVFIGEYDKNSEFRVSDIETSIKDKTKRDLAFIFAALIPIVSAIIGLTTNLKQKTQEITKPLIENTDSIANKAKAVKPILEDSFKLGQKIIKK